jgi:hypothetical protein
MELHTETTTEPKAATTLTAPAASPRIDVAAVVKDLASSRAKTRKAAEATVKEFGPDEFEELLQLAREQSTTHWKNKSLARRVVAAGGILAVLVIVMLLVNGILFGKWGDLSGLGGAFGPMVSMLVVGAAALSGAHRGLAHAMEHFDDVRAVGPLVDVLASSEKPLVEAATQALKRLLPRVTEADSELLTGPQQKALAVKLLTSGDREFIEAALIALGHVGGEQTLPALQELALGGTQIRHPKEVRAASRETLARIQARLIREKEVTTLLRPSAHAPSAEALLRPAGSTAAEDPDRLLRAASDGQGMRE